MTMIVLLLHGKSRLHDAIHHHAVIERQVEDFAEWAVKGIVHLWLALDARRLSGRDVEIIGDAEGSRHGGRVDLFIELRGKGGFGVVEAGMHDRETETAFRLEHARHRFEQRVDIHDIHDRHVADDRVEPVATEGGELVWVRRVDDLVIDWVGTVVSRFAPYSQLDERFGEVTGDDVASEIGKMPGIETIAAGEIENGFARSGREEPLHRGADQLQVEGIALAHVAVPVHGVAFPDFAGLSRECRALDVILTHGGCILTGRANEWRFLNDTGTE